MSKLKTIFVCSDCGAEFTKWAGQCSACHAWNTISEFRQASLPKTHNAHRRAGYAGKTQAALQLLADVPAEQIARSSVHSKEFDRVLGGGLVAGSATLIGGDPGIGKSTLLLQTACQLAETNKVLYVTGEESCQQVSLRAKRLNLANKPVQLLAETQVEAILQQAQQFQPDILIIDSIQTCFTDGVSSAPGTVSQVRESAAQLVQYAKQGHTALFLVGHVTKEGALAGPRVLEHMVDTVLYFEGRSDSRFRVIRAVKNRFGAVNEMGVFAMTDKGLQEVTNPSAIFLSHDRQDQTGSLVMVTWEGSRPLLVEVQALVDDSAMPNPRRVCVGFENNRLGMLLAVLSRVGGVPCHAMDVFVNVVGGIKVQETAIDAAVIGAIVSSLKNKPLPPGLVVFGEIGLSGEIRPVQSGQERLKEAAKHGFTRAIVPKGNYPKQPIDGLQVCGVKQLSELLAELN